MNLYSFLDLGSFFALLLALLFALRNRRATGQAIPSPLFAVIVLALLAALGGTLSWSGLSGILVGVEEATNTLLPLAFFGFFAMLIFHSRAGAQASRNQVLAAIHAVTGKETHPEDPFGAVRDLLGRVGDLLKFDFACIYQPQREESLQLAASWRMPPELAQSFGRLDPSITSLSRVLETGEPLVVGRVANFPDPITQVLDQNGFTSVAIFPLTTRNQSQGILVLGSVAGYHFSEEVIDLLRFLSRHLGEALLNDRLQAEAKLRSAELARVSDTRTLFLSMVSHDLRDPLMVIKGAMLVIHQYLDKASNEDVRRAVEMASGSSRRLEKLISDMMDLARLDSGGIRLEFVPVDPVTEVKAMGEEIRPEAVKKGVTLEFDLPSRLPPMEVDKARLHQMVRNLLANAVKFTPPGGKVTLAAESDGENIRLRVSDTGVGIPPEEIPRIFEMFYRGSTAGPNHAGSGLGLPIVREVVRLHGGQIQAESNPGHGSSFTITLPRVHLP